jgi:hypothetical protein
MGIQPIKHVELLPEISQRFQTAKSLNDSDVKTLDLIVKGFVKLHGRPNDENAHQRAYNAALCAMTRNDSRGYISKSIASAIDKRLVGSSR